MDGCVNVCLDESKVTFNLYALAEKFTPKKLLAGTKTKHFVIALIMDFTFPPPHTHTHMHIEKRTFMHACMCVFLLDFREHCCICRFPGCCSQSLWHWGQLNCRHEFTPIFHYLNAICQLKMLGKIST